MVEEEDTFTRVLVDVSCMAGVHIYWRHYKETHTSLIGTGVISLADVYLSQTVNHRTFPVMVPLLHL